MSNINKFIDYCDSMMISTEANTISKLSKNIGRYIIIKKDIKRIRKTIKETLIAKGIPVKAVSSIKSGNAAKDCIIRTFHGGYDDDNYFVMVIITLDQTKGKINEDILLDTVFDDIVPVKGMKYHDAGVMNTKDKSTYGVYLCFKNKDAGRFVSSNDTTEYWGH